MLKFVQTLFYSHKTSDSLSNEDLSDEWVVVDDLTRGRVEYKDGDVHGQDEEDNYGGLFDIPIDQVGTFSVL